MQGGTVRWMGPELLDPQRFGFKDSRPTRHSDCYALGMVLYEVLSERIPFYRHANLAVVGHVIEGKRPRRPQGVVGSWFTDDVWGVLECCWMPQPDSRPGIEDVLQCLKKTSESWTPPPPGMVNSTPTTDLPISSSSDSSVGGSTSTGEVLSPSQDDRSQPSSELQPEGDPDGNSVHPPTDKFPAPLRRGADRREFGVHVKGCEGTPDTVGVPGLLNGFWY